jgi:hypothetical protein
MAKKRGGTIKSIKSSRRKAYYAMRGKLGKTMAAKIANYGTTFAKRSAMAKKAARTRKRRG